MGLQILVLPIVVLLLFYLFRWIARAGLGVVLSILLAAALGAGGFAARNSIGLPKHLSMSDGGIGIQVSIAAACGIAGYLVVAGIEELRRLKDADGRRRPRP